VKNAVASFFNWCGSDEVRLLILLLDLLLPRISGLVLLSDKAFLFEVFIVFEFPFARLEWIFLQPFLLIIVLILLIPLLEKGVLLSFAPRIVELGEPTKLPE
jgi:hypothetical protein